MCKFCIERAEARQYSGSVKNGYTKPYDDVGEWLQMGRTFHNVSVRMSVCRMCWDVKGIVDKGGDVGIINITCPVCQGKQDKVKMQFLECPEDIELEGERVIL